MTHVKAVLNNGTTCMVPHTNIDLFRRVNANLLIRFDYPNEDGTFEEPSIIDEADSVLTKALDGFRKENEDLEKENESLKLKIKTLEAELKKANNKSNIKTKK
jgi:hypothetical protein